MFRDEKGDNASMVEMEASRRRRKGTEVPLTKTEELQLKRTQSHGNDPRNPMALTRKV